VTVESDRNIEQETTPNATPPTVLYTLRIVALSMLIYEL